MALRLSNTAPETLQARLLGQSIYMGLKSETLPTDCFSQCLGIPAQQFQHHGAIPTGDTSLSAIGASSRSRHPSVDGLVSASAGISLSSGQSSHHTKTTNGADELSVCKITIPTQNTTSLLGYFKFRKKNALGTVLTRIGVISPTSRRMYFAQAWRAQYRRYAFLREQNPRVQLYLEPSSESQYRATRPA